MSHFWTTTKTTKIKQWFLKQFWKKIFAKNTVIFIANKVGNPFFLVPWFWKISFFSEFGLFHGYLPNFLTFFWPKQWGASFFNIFIFLGGAGTLQLWWGYLRGFSIFRGLHGAPTNWSGRLKWLCWPPKWAKWAKTTTRGRKSIKPIKIAK